VSRGSGSLYTTGFLDSKIILSAIKMALVVMINFPTRLKSSLGVPVLDLATRRAVREDGTEGSRMDLYIDVVGFIGSYGSTGVAALVVALTSLVWPHHKLQPGVAVVGELYCHGAPLRLGLKITASHLKPVLLSGPTKRLVVPVPEYVKSMVMIALHEAKRMHKENRVQIKEGGLEVVGYSTLAELLTYCFIFQDVDD